MYYLLFLSLKTVLSVPFRSLLNTYLNVSSALFSVLTGKGRGLGGQAVGVLTMEVSRRYA
jgi:hypothetical protein